MTSHSLSFRSCAVAGILVLLVSSALISGCLRTEPGELLPNPLTQSPLSPQLTVTPSPAQAAIFTENLTSVSGPVHIESISEIDTYAEMDFPAEVKQAVTDFISRKTTDTVNGFLRWESVRTRTNQSDAARIREIGSATRRVS